MFIQTYGWQVFWLVLLIAFLVIELITVGLTTIWLAGGALAAFLLAVAGMNIWVQVFACLLVSFLLIYFTRPLAVKYLNPRRTRTNSDSLIGETVRVTACIDNRSATGTVLVNGMEWSARAVSDDLVLAPDTLVTVLRIEGVKLIVEPAEQKVEGTA